MLASHCRFQQREPKRARICTNIYDVSDWVNGAKINIFIYDNEKACVMIP